MHRGGAGILIRVLLGAALLSAAPRTLPAQTPAATDSIAGTAWTTADWRILEITVRRAAAARIDTLPIGDAIALVGRGFVGARYTPGTLEAPGAERLIINLREFDCVTFVEHVLALVQFARHDGTAALQDAAGARARYERLLADLRYRDGRLDGYASRLHYFSDWLADHERRGMLRVLGDEIGTGTDARPITFMTAHVAAYAQLADSAVRRRIADHEATLGPRRMVPKSDVRRLEPLLRDGDVLAMTSTLEGLDVAHVGFAVLVDGRPHLLNAPLVGKSVELSPLPLHEHLAARRSQSGVMVARLPDAR